LAVAPDGSWLASASDDYGPDATVRIWDPHTGQARHTLTGYTRPVTALTVAPDGSWLASASNSHDGTVRIWDPHTGQARHTLTGHNSPVTALAAAPNGFWLASAGDDATVRIWDVPAGRCSMSFRTGHPLRLVVFDGQRVVAAGDRGPYFLDVSGVIEAECTDF
jgi:WD40 repeat protein